MMLDTAFDIRIDVLREANKDFPKVRWICLKIWTKCKIDTQTGFSEQ